MATRLLTTHEVANWLRMEPNAVSRKSTNIPGRVRINGRTRWNEDVIQEWIENGGTGLDDDEPEEQEAETEQE